uniref:Ovule protein n=1 Tax=Caenorhabditis tropicalis TaxID=1561998 RepID=A0A1I7T943_9PELO
MSCSLSLAHWFSSDKAGHKRCEPFSFPKRNPVSRDIPPFFPFLFEAEWSLKYRFEVSNKVRSKELKFWFIKEFVKIQWFNHPFFLESSFIHS